MASSLPLPPDVAAHDAPPDEARTRHALLHMLEDLQRERDIVRTARQRWLQTVDALGDPLMVHDRDLRVVRCNKAYAERAGLPYEQLLGRPYWECFPKREGPLPGCANHAAGAAQDAEVSREEITLDDGTILLSRAFAVSSADEGAPSWSLHVFEDITRQRRAELEARAVTDVAASRAIIDGDVEAVARQITEAAATVTRVARANVWLFNDAEDELRCIDLFEQPPGRHSSGMVLREEQFRNEFQALKQAPYVDASEPLTDPRTAGYVESYLKPLGITSMLDTVVEVSEKHLGLLCLEHVGRPHRWTPDEIAFAAQLADKVAVAISRRSTREGEAALRESEEKFRVIFDHSHDGIVVLNAEGHTVRFANASMERMLGYGPGELAGVPMTLLHPPQTHEFVRRQLEGADLHDPQEVVMDLPMQTKDGRLVYMDLTGASIVLDGQHCLLGAFRDATERRTAEEQLRTSRDLLGSIIEHAPIRVFWKDTESRYLGCNTLFARDAGMTRPDELLGKDDTMTPWREQAALYRADDQQVMASDTPKLGFEEP